MINTKKKEKFCYVVIGIVCNLYLMSVEIVGFCNRLITIFNGDFLTVIVDDGGDGKRIIEGEFDFCLQSDVSLRIGLSSSSSIFHRLLSSSSNNG